MKIKYISLLALSLFILLSCSSNDDGIQPKPNSEYVLMKFEIGIAPQIETRVATDVQFKSVFEDGDAIGIFAVKRAKDNTTATLKAKDNYLHNLKMTATSSGAAWIPEINSYYPSDGDVLDFYAYYPYNANMTNPLDFTFDVLADQNGSNYNKSDLLFAKTIGVSKEGIIHLDFKHMLALVQIRLNPEINVPLLDGDFKVTLKNVQTQSSFNWTTATATGTTTDITMHKVANTTGTYRALVPAQTLTNEKKRFTFVQTTKNKEIDFYYKLSASITLAASKVTPFYVKLGWGIDSNHQYALNDAYPHIGRKIGIVFMLENPIGGKSKNGKIVGLNDGGNFVWGPLSISTKATDKMNGMLNQAIIEIISGWEANYLAFNWCSKQGSRWYLPSINELQHLFCTYNGKAPIFWNSGIPGLSADAAARSGFNEKLIAAGGTEMQEFSHWSSTEYSPNDASRLDFKDGFTVKNESKNKLRIVRAILQF